MTTISPSTAPAATRQLGAWLKFGAIILTTFVVCWAIVIWYWNATEQNPGVTELALALLLLPVALLCALWGGHKVVSARTDSAASVAGVATPELASSTAAGAQAGPVLAVVATALRSPYGASVEELAGAIADNEARADLDQELVDDNGFPVMTARIDEANDDMLQEEIAEWLSSQGIQAGHFTEEQWRAITLATGVAGELASLAAADYMHCEEQPPTLHLKLMLPYDWSGDSRRAATMWLKHTVSQYGWPEAAIAAPEPEQDQWRSPTIILTQLLHSDSAERTPLVAIVIACASLVGQESVDRLAANAALFNAATGRGQIPGEGACGLLLTDLRQAQSLNGGQMAMLGPLHERRHENSADDARRPDSALLLDMTEQLCKAGAIELAQIDMIVADTVYRPNRVLELMGLAAPAIPRVDAADDIVRVGLGSGSCGAVPWLTVLALACHYALERAAPVLCISNEDPYVRGAALVHPAPGADNCSA